MSKDSLSLFSRLTPDPRGANSISNNQWYSADSLPSDDQFINQDEVQVEEEKQEKIFIPPPAYKRDQKDVTAHQAIFNLQVVPEMTLEES